MLRFPLAIEERFKNDLWLIQANFLKGPANQLYCLDTMYLCGVDSRSCAKLISKILRLEIVFVLVHYGRWYKKAST